MQCAEEAQGSGEDATFTTPRLLSGSEMKTLLQWEEPESHPLATLEKQITVRIADRCFLEGLLTLLVFLPLQDLCKEEDSLETMLENVIVLKQVLETATDTPATNELEPTLPAPETLAAQFKNRYQICLPLA